MRKLLLLAALLAALSTPASATLTTTNSVISYTSNGMTLAYAVPFRFLDGSHLVVTKTVSGVTTALVLGTDYTVTGANLAAGGTVTLGAAIPNGATLKIARSTPKTQTCSLRTQGPATYASIEDCLDRAEMQIQEMNDGTFTSLIATPITTAQATTAAPSTVPNSANTNSAGSSSAFAAADHVHALAVGPMVSANRATAQSFTAGAVTIVVYDTEERDTDGAYDPSTGRFTVPTGKGGDYEFCAAVTILATGTPPNNAAFSIFRNAVEVKRLAQRGETLPASVDTSLGGCTIINAAAGEVYDARLQASTNNYALRAAAVTNHLSIKRIQ